MPMKTIIALSTLGVNEFLNPDVTWLDLGPFLLPGCLKPDTILILMEEGVC